MRFIFWINLLSINLLMSCSSTGSKELTSVYKEEFQETNALLECPQIIKNNHTITNLLQAYKIDKNSQSVSVSFIDASLKEALFEISVNADIPIMFDENVSGLTTLNVESQPIESILRMLTFSGPYDFRKFKDFYYFGVVDANLPSWQKISYIQTYEPHHISPEELVTALPKNVQSFVTIDKMHHRVTINATRSLMIETLKYISKLDRPQHQISLKLTIIELDKEKYIKKGKNLRLGSLYDFFPIKLASHQVTQPTILSGSRFQDFLYSLQALKRKGAVEVRAQPKLITREGVAAKFLSGKRTIIKNEQGGSLTGARLNFIESGVQFNIIPRVAKNNEIHLKILDSKASSFDEENLSVSEHQIATDLIVKQGESILFGGMIQKNKEMIVTKVPIIGDIPVLGYFFKSKEKKFITKEIIFSIKPEILCQK